MYISECYDFPAASGALFVAIASNREGVFTFRPSRSVLCVCLQVLALSSRSWLSYNYQGRYQMTPLSFDPLDFAAEFSTEMCPEGVVAVSGEKLRIFGVERLGEVFNQAALPLRSA